MWLCRTDYENVLIFYWDYMHRTEIIMKFKMIIQNSGEKIEMNWNKSV